MHSNKALLSTFPEECQTKAFLHCKNIQINRLNIFYIYVDLMHIHKHSDTHCVRTHCADGEDRSLLHIEPRRCSGLRLTARRFNARRCTQLPAQDFLIRVGDLAPASPRNKSPSLSGAFPEALLGGISLSARWLSSPDIFIQEKKKMETVYLCVVFRRRESILNTRLSQTGLLEDRRGGKSGQNVNHVSTILKSPKRFTFTLSADDAVSKTRKWKKVYGLFILHKWGFCKFNYPTLMFLFSLWIRISLEISHTEQEMSSLGAFHREQRG